MSILQLQQIIGLVLAFLDLRYCNRSSKLLPESTLALPSEVLVKAMNIDKIRQRAAEVVVEKHGQLGHQAIRALAANAIHETVLGRILLPDQYKNPTRKPRKSTLAALAAALGVSANWLVHGVGSRQIDVWPSLVRMEADSPEPWDQLGTN